MKEIRVRDILENAGGKLDLKVLHGEEYLGRPIPEIAINRPGLALAGFVQYFANKRLQVFGLAETTYLKSLDASVRRERLEEMMGYRIPCVILTRSRKPVPEMLEVCAKARVPILQTSMITSEFMNMVTLVMEGLAAPHEHVHGTLMDIMGIGTLLKGEAGVGKSETALSLIERGHSLVADDLTILRRDGSGILRGKAAESTRYHMEIRGLGLIHVPSLFGMASVRKEKVLDLMVRLYRTDDPTDADRTGLDGETRDVLGVPVPVISLPVAAGRDMAHVVEVAAMNQKLKILGHDAAKDLNERLKARMRVAATGESDKDGSR